MIMITKYITYEWFWITSVIMFTFSSGHYEEKNVNTNKFNFLSIVNGRRTSGEKLIEGYKKTSY